MNRVTRVAASSIAALTDQQLEQAQARKPELLFSVPPERRTERMYLGLIVKAGGIEALLSEEPACYWPQQVLTRRLMLTAIEADPRLLGCIDPVLRTEPMYLNAVMRGSAHRLPENFNQERIPPHCATRAVVQRLEREPEVAMFVVPDDLLTESMVLGVIGRQRFQLELVPSHLRTDAVCERALAADFRGAWPHVPDARKTAVLCDRALQQSAWNAAAIPDRHWDDAKVDAALMKVPRALRSLPAHRQTVQRCRDVLTAIANAARHGKAANSHAEFAVTLCAEIPASVALALHADTSLSAKIRQWALEGLAAMPAETARVALETSDLSDRRQLVIARKIGLSDRVLALSSSDTEKADALLQMLDWDA